MASSIKLPLDRMPVQKFPQVLPILPDSNFPYFKGHHAGIARGSKYRAHLSKASAHEMKPMHGGSIFNRDDKELKEGHFQVNPYIGQQEEVKRRMKESGEWDDSKSYAWNPSKGEWVAQGVMGGMHGRGANFQVGDAQATKGWGVWGPTQWENTGNRVAFSPESRAPIDVYGNLSANYEPAKESPMEANPGVPPPPDVLAAHRKAELAGKKHAPKKRRAKRQSKKGIKKGSISRSLRKLLKI